MQQVNVPPRCIHLPVRFYIRMFSECLERLVINGTGLNPVVGGSPVLVLHYQVDGHGCHPEDGNQHQAVRSCAQSHADGCVHESSENGEEPRYRRFLTYSSVSPSPAQSRKNSGESSLNLSLVIVCPLSLRARPFCTVFAAKIRAHRRCFP